MGKSGDRLRVGGDQLGRVGNGGDWGGGERWGRAGSLVGLGDPS